MPAFILHPQLENDSLFVTSTQNIQIRLVKDSRFFWLLLIPERNDITEWHELDKSELQALTFLISAFSRTLKDIEKADKINIGALGNVVSQFHFHILARHQNDENWPGPVWGSAPTGQDNVALFEERIQKLAPIIDR
ncbi:MAG: HIT family protein, partial [Candidatus Puniceispirillaceae bacterium]